MDLLAIEVELMTYEEKLQIRFLFECIKSL